MMLDMAIECYSQRLLNPFRGISCTIRYQCAEAVTTDGHHWDIYVRNELMLGDIDADARHKVLTNDLRYGSWSPEEGLRRGPMYPSDDLERLEQIGDVVYRALLERHDQLPFPLRDCFELWLLDADGVPLALIDSVSDERDMDLEQAATWRAGQRCRREFRCRVFDELDGTSGNGNAAEYLERHVNDLAGARPSAQWMRRHGNGGATGLAGIALDDELEGRHLEGTDFPPLLLRRSSESGFHQQLVDAFHAWQAPWLLLLPQLSHEQRERFEHLAPKHADAVAEQYRLYPRIIDQRPINTARVAARMHATNKENGPIDDEDHSIFYIELTGSE